MWIFGYGSLVWKVDFPYVKKVIGYIKGYERRFWQASIDHRGVPEKPGRVVTLVPSQDPEARVWGVVYQIDDDDTETINSIDHRERRFTKISIPFYPFENKCNNSYFFDTIVYIGPPNGPQFLGEASVKDIAHQIANTSGPSGPNSEYVFKLSNCMRELFPDVQDDHLFSAKVWGAAYKIHQRDIDRVVQHLDLREVMGYEKVPIEFHPIPSHPQNVLEPASPFDYNNVAKNLVANRPDRLVLNEDTEEDEGISLVTPSSSGQSPSSPDGILEYSDNDSHAHEISQGKVFTVFMYYGSSENEHYIGPAPVESMAKQIFESIGPSGKNKEYLFKLCQAMRQICDEAMDNHLVELEDAVRELEVEYNLRSPGTPIEL